MEKVTSAAGLSSSSARRVWGPMVAVAPFRSWGTGRGCNPLGYPGHPQPVPECWCLAPRGTSAPHKGSLCICWAKHPCPGLLPSPASPRARVSQHVQGACCPRRPTAGRATHAQGCCHHDPTAPAFPKGLFSPWGSCRGCRGMKASRRQHYAPFLIPCPIPAPQTPGLGLFLGCQVLRALPRASCIGLA